MNTDYRCYFKFLRFSLGLYEGDEFLHGKVLEGFDWNEFHRFAQSQTLVGVVFEGIRKLPKQNAPKPDLLLKWMGQSRLVNRQNCRLNTATAAIYNKVEALGFRCCILKGQGNALMYPDAYMRTPGDIDVWVNADREEIRRLAHLLAKDNGTVGKESMNHIELTVDGVAVELHSTPGIMANPVYDRRLQKWFRRNADLQCSNRVALPDGVGDIAVPTHAFNAIYQLYHLYHHYFFEGVGMRQVIDYLFNMEILKDGKMEILKDGKMEVLKAGKGEILERELRHLGLWKFAGAVMWVLHETLGLPEDMMIAPMDGERGRLLLDEILEGGNFGQHGKRRHYGRSTLGHNVQRILRDLQLMKYYPAEALSEPVFRTWHFFWRISHKSH